MSLSFSGRTLPEVILPLFRLYHAISKRKTCIIHKYPGVFPAFSWISESNAQGSGENSSKIEASPESRGINRRKEYGIALLFFR
jgi:hypothetical protein